MAAAALSPSWTDHDDRPIDDHIIRLSGATWADYQRLLKVRGDHSAPRFAFLEGEIEIMSPSSTHESIKSHLGCLVEVYCFERGIEFAKYGSWTLENEEAERGAEPDECYVLGDAAAIKPPVRPDLAIEVVWTSGRLDKLAIYRKLGVREVWYWRKGTITPYGLRDERYEALTASEVLPGIDLAQLAGFLERPTTSQSIREYRAALIGG